MPKKLYSGYLFLFLFDNAINHSVYTSNILQGNNMNKNTEGQQVQLRNKWFNYNGVQINQPMSFQKSNEQLIQKEIQKVLKNQNL